MKGYDSQEMAVYNRPKLENATSFYPQNQLISNVGAPTDITSDMFDPARAVPTAGEKANRKTTEEQPSEEKWAAEREELLAKLDIATKGHLEALKEIAKLQGKEREKSESPPTGKGGGKGAKGKGKAKGKPMAKAKGKGKGTKKRSAWEDWR